MEEFIYVRNGTVACISTYACTESGVVEGDPVITGPHDDVNGSGRFGPPVSLT